MKKTYRQPYIDVTVIDMELLLTTGSEKNKYDIGSDSSKWPSKGDVHDDTGNGPGVSVPRSITLMRSGATKEPYFYSSLGRAENEESCLPGEETRYTLQVYPIFRQRGCVRFF